jgi:AraC family transcriptional regulator of adaptative response / DNA-3-methyladenine glycosylase II
MNHQTTIAGNASDLDPEACRRARLARDPRFDGEFFLAVRTTGIYCRPVCPARAPSERNVTYFRSAAQAAGAGYRPCLRCRPESAPDSPAWLGTSTTVRRALGLIREGALNDGGLAALAARLGVGERYLRKLFQRELGASPRDVALNQRLLFARKLLAETGMPITEVAFAAGFGSVRRFNSAVREQFHATPGELRARRKPKGDNAAIRLQLHYRPPYDWAGVIGFFGRHAVAGVETVGDDCYQRTITAGGRGTVRVRPLPGRNALQLELELPDHSQLMPVVARVRRMFDLDANPAVVQAALATDDHLAPLLAHYPGIRSPLHWSPFEAAIRAIVGQQVSTLAARTTCSRLAAAAADPGESPAFPPAAALAALDAGHFPMPGRRRETLLALCRAYAGREEALALEALATFRGVGPWTVSMVALRGFGNPDTFPAGDLGLERAWQALSPGPLPLHSSAAGWRPWRAYAANLLWRSLNP